MNFFQPSLKLRVKDRADGRVRRTYDRARTPFRRLVAAGVLDSALQARYAAIFAALDPVRLLRQIEHLQDALWRTAVTSAVDLPTEIRFDVDACSASNPASEDAGREPVPFSRHGSRTGSQVREPLGTRTYRTRPDPFAEVWCDIEQWLADDAGRTGRDALRELQRRYPGIYPDTHLRTLQPAPRQGMARAHASRVRRWMARRGLARRYVLPGTASRRESANGRGDSVSCSMLTGSWSTSGISIYVDKHTDANAIDYGDSPNDIAWIDDHAAVLRAMVRCILS